jgi:membrane fusion protein (multidrug efflux system)
MSSVATDVPTITEAEPASRSRRATVVRAVALVVLLVAASWGVRRWLISRHEVTTDNAQLDGHITPIAPKVQAFVSRVLVDDNQQVKAGDTLVVLDAKDFVLRLEQARAELASAAAAAGTGRGDGQAAAQAAAARSQAAGARAAIAGAEAAYKKAAADLERYRSLASTRVIAAQQLDAAQAAYDAAAAALETARRQALAAGSQASASEAGVRAADARLAAARAAAENAAVQLSYTVLLAPADGIIAKRNVEPGELVQPGQALLSVVPQEEVWVTANLKETQLGNVKVGDAVQFTVDAYGGQVFHGTVESLSPATGATFALLPPDNATGNFTKVVQRVPVRIKVTDAPDPLRPLRPGMSVEVTIQTS